MFVPTPPVETRDESLTSEEYIRPGLAAPNCELSGIDLAEARIRKPI